MDGQRSRQQSVRNIQSHLRLKMEVPYNEHPGLIGQNGWRVRTICQWTGCSIHFADTNKMDVWEKNNRVVIAGCDLHALNVSRKVIRMISPLVIRFLVDAPVFFAAWPNEHIFQAFAVVMERIYEVEVKFSTRPPTQILIMVQGVQMMAQNVAMAVKHIMEELGIQTVARNILDIRLKYHSFIMGPGRCNLQKLMEDTHTVIDSNDPTNDSLPPVKKSLVNITGQVDDVITARSLLIGMQPVMLTFELPWMHSVTHLKKQLKLSNVGLDVEVYDATKPRRGPKVVIVGKETNMERINEMYEGIMEKVQQYLSPKKSCSLL